jgi:putative tryptophan/tyrosine transport system substrate-binding protein
MKTIGFLHSGKEKTHSEHYAAFLQGLTQFGFEEGADFAVTPKWSNDDRDTLQANAKALATGASIDFIVAAGGTKSAQAALEETEKAATGAAPPKPIVFTTVSDPVGLKYQKSGGVFVNLVDDLDDPGHPRTGIAALTAELDPRRLELLHELMPTAKKVGALYHSDRPQITTEKAALTAAASNLNITTLDWQDVNPKVAGHATIDGAFQSWKQIGANPVTPAIVTADPYFHGNRSNVVKAARQNAGPAIYQWREFVSAGGLMSYGPIITDCYRQAGIYAARIVDGDKAENIPVMLPTTFELVINLKTASKLRKDIGLVIPGTLLARAVLVRSK